MLERAEKEVQEKDKELQRVHDEDLAVLNSMRCKVCHIIAWSIVMTIGMKAI